MTGRHGLGDPRIPWTILLRAGEDPSADRLRRLAALTPDPVTVDRHGDTVLIAADHARLDGLALLLVLEDLLGTPIRSSAAGVSRDRPNASLSRAAFARARELVLDPPAVPAPAQPGGAVTADAFATARVEGHVGTAGLVSAGARAVARWNRERGSRPRQVSVAIGVSTVGGADATIGDHSGYLRLTHVETMTRDDVRAAMATAPLQPGGRTPPGPVGRLAGAVAGAMAGRLGSSLLVSHLGRVDTDACTDLAFYPVTGGASGVSLGAVGIAGHTTITLRARGTRYDEDGLRALLETVLGELG